MKLIRAHIWLYTKLKASEQYLQILQHCIININLATTYVCIYRQLYHFFIAYTVLKHIFSAWIKALNLKVIFFNEYEPTWRNPLQIWLDNFKQFSAPLWKLFQYVSCEYDLLKNITKKSKALRPYINTT